LRNGPCLQFPSQPRARIRSFHTVPIRVVFASAHVVQGKKQKRPNLCQIWILLDEFEDQALAKFAWAANTSCIAQRIEGERQEKWDQVGPISLSERSKLLIFELMSAVVIALAPISKARLVVLMSSTLLGVRASEKTKGIEREQVGTRESSIGSSMCTR
jgi:hypothetical protein